MAKKEEHKHELLENPEALKEKLAGAESWLESNPKIVIGVAAAILIDRWWIFRFQLLQGLVRMNWPKRKCFRLFIILKQTVLDKALNGDGNNLGFLEHY